MGISNGCWEEESKSQKRKDRKDNGGSVALINKRTEALYSTVAVEGIVSTRVEGSGSRGEAWPATVR